MKSPATYIMPSVKRGDTVKWPTFQLVGDDEVPIDITGASVDIWWRRGSARGAIVLKQSTSDASITLTVPAGGKLKATSNTVQWPAGLYVADLQLVSNEVVQTPLILNITVLEDSTKKTY
jgi:hypothetical protein